MRSVGHIDRGDNLNRQEGGGDGNGRIRHGEGVGAVVQFGELNGGAGLVVDGGDAAEIVPVVRAGGQRDKVAGGRGAWIDGDGAVGRADGYAPFGFGDVLAVFAVIDEPRVFRVYDGVLRVSSSGLDEYERLAVGGVAVDIDAVFKSYGGGAALVVDVYAVPRLLGHINAEAAAGKHGRIINDERRAILGRGIVVQGDIAEGDSV